MGYYCSWGDVKTACSSEEEGYESRASGIGEKRSRVSASWRPSDADRQFWAEDELSSTESRQRLTTRRKRRRSRSYRNRAANRSRSRAPCSPSSSSNSVHAETSVRKTRRHGRCRVKKIERFANTEITCASREATCARDNVDVTGPPSTSGQTLAGARCKSSQTMLSSTNHYEQTDDTEQDDRNNLSEEIKK